MGQSNSSKEQGSQISEKRGIVIVTEQDTGISEMQEESGIVNQEDSGMCKANRVMDVRELKFDGKLGELRVVLDEIARLERRIFPKHESLASCLELEIKKKNSGLLYAVHRGGDSDSDIQRNLLPSPATILVVGYVMYTFRSCIMASITKLAVKENFRRQGYGESLLKEAILKCRSSSAQRVILHVDPTRTAALALYMKLGFNIDALVRSYYSPKRDAYRMFLDLEFD
eukprot:c20168_g1_i1 orf=319-1002(-)